MRIALAQINTTVGDLEGNLDRIRRCAKSARGLGADLAVFPELCVPGYPPWDLLEHEAFVKRNVEALETLARSIEEPAVLVGFAERRQEPGGRRLHNAAALLHQGRVVAVRAKSLLPTYDVFDESRYFEPAKANDPIRWGDHRIGVTICEDAWNQQGFWPRPLYSADPVARQIESGVDLLVNLSSSPYHRGKTDLRLGMLQSHARRARVPLAYCNLVGGNDELIFDGNSLVLDGQGRVLARGRAFEEDLVVVDLASASPPADSGPVDDAQEVRRALVLGLADYARKTGFKEALVGLSGGIDSALVAALAAEALGPARVTGVSMPSKYSSRGSVTDARTLAKNLGLRLLSLPIRPPFDAYLRTLSKGLGGRKLKDLAQQNLQARIRGTLLMALSNQTGALLLSTGNKSELSTGYCTLYGDLSGGLAILADVPKTLVYRVARRINQDKPLIPEASLTKPPSAELKPGQQDQDDLPPYETLDAVLEAYIEEGLDIEEIAGRGVPRRLALDILGRVDRSEYKRRQAPPGLKITPKAFGIGRKMPVARGGWRR